MELKDYTTKELQEELNRRKLLAREQKQLEREQKPICDNCKHCVIEKSGGVTFYYCGAMTYTTKNGRTYNYVVSKSTKCKFDMFEHK